jgi:hypothetical protein
MTRDGTFREQKGLLVVSNRNSGFNQSILFAEACFLPGSVSPWHPLYRALIQVKDCPKCRLVNPDSALRCDCGYDFPSGTMQSSYLTNRDKLLKQTSVGIVAGGFLIWGVFRVVSLFARGVLPGLLSAGLLFLVVAYFWPRYFSRAGRR